MTLWVPGGLSEGFSTGLYRLLRQSANRIDESIKRHVINSGPPGRIGPKTRYDPPGSPIAVRTWLRVALPEEQAVPSAKAMESLSDIIRALLSTPGKLTFRT